MSDQTAQSDSNSPVGNISRRSLLRVAGAGAAVIGGGGLLQACSSGIKGASSGSGGTKAITIGWIHPLTGSLAGFGAPDNWVVSKIKQTTPYKNGFKIGGKTYSVTIKSYDTQSSPTRAGDLAKTAILNDGVNLLLASSTPETVNAVSSQAETLGTPLICANIPWEAWYANLGGNPLKPTVKPKYVVMYFLGAEHLVKAFIPMWDRIHAQLHTDKVVAAAFPNDSDGNAFRAVFPPIAKGAGYTFDVSSPYPDGTTNYSSMISAFKSANADFFTNVPLPPDFATMWKQSVQQGFKPKLATVAKVLLFPPDAYALGSLVDNVATDAWWVPSLPWKSSFTGETCQQMANEFEAATNGQWNSNISNYSLFEAAHAALTSVSDPHDKAEVADAIHKVNIRALAGPLNFASGGPAPGVAITPPVGVQWQKGTKYPLEMQVVDNTLQPQAKITADLKPTNP
ncbi:MAG: branched-chain amino acid transport system substrate-binding protein [Streptosporangiaceae bacterium]|jgi:branched-chain amino acid transport system substrate-binding protein|nr:branched-chain amino acid transport system substrate-binding protein [Streptosporangiaceae bacterium]